MRLRALARDRDCQIRLPGVCCGSRESVVLAHFRMSGLSGIGFKVPDLIGAWACSACHTYVDTHKDAQTQLDFAKAVFRTQAQLLKEGEISERPAKQALSE